MTNYIFFEAFHINFVKFGNTVTLSFLEIRYLVSMDNSRPLFHCRRGGLIRAGLL
jgi:hypothetical protein